MPPSRENLTEFQAIESASPGARNLTRVAFSLGGGSDPDGRMQRRQHQSSWRAARMKKHVLYGLWVTLTFVVAACRATPPNAPPANAPPSESSNTSTTTKATVAAPSAAPVSSGYADVNGLKIYYEVHGQGKPIVLVHGS
jgi:hypothetical protein